MRLNVTDNYFYYVKEHPENKVIVYGAGYFAKKNYKYMGSIDFFCDQNARQIGSIDKIVCITPEELFQMKETMIILISIKDRRIVDSVCQTIEQSGIDAEVFSFFDNPAFSWFDISKYIYIPENVERLKICIVYSNDGWIFGKFANKLRDGLEKLGQEVEIAETENPDADVNHFIGFGGLNQFYLGTHTVRTTMITHIDSQLKRDLIKFQAANGAVGICMSSDMMNKLSLWGVPREKLCYVNPAQDGEIRPRKIILGITNRCYSGMDYRKRDDMILQICQKLDKDCFMIKIMGSGWEKTVAELQKAGFEVEYHDEFQKETYKELMRSLDLWFYYGFDEGAMGFLDAVAAGVKTIATPQGFHLDVRGGLTYPCSTIDEFIQTLKQIQDEKKELSDKVRTWTWDEYARKHLEIWQYLTGTKSLKMLYRHQSEYMDGIFSLMVSDISL